MVRFKAGDEVLYEGERFTIKHVSDDPDFDYTYALRWNGHGSVRWIHESEASPVPGSEPETPPATTEPIDFTNSLEGVELLASIAEINRERGDAATVNALSEAAMRLVLIRFSQLPGDVGKLATAALAVGSPREDNPKAV